MTPETTSTSEAAERLRLRYPRSRLPRPLLVVAVVVLAAVFLGWLVWTAAVQSAPSVAGRVLTYEVLTDQQTRVTFTVERPDPSVPVVCDVIVQAPDFSIVGRVDRYLVAPRTEPVVDVTIVVKTLRRGTSASVRSCSVP